MKISLNDLGGFVNQGISKIKLSDIENYQISVNKYASYRYEPHKYDFTQCK